MGKIKGNGRDYVITRLTLTKALMVKDGTGIFNKDWWAILAGQQLL